jgi:hypothetical protein
MNTGSPPPKKNRDFTFDSSYILKEKEKSNPPIIKRNPLYCSYIIFKVLFFYYYYITIFILRWPLPYVHFSSFICSDNDVLSKIDA